MEKKFEFKPFDKVLVRDNDGDVWSCSLYSNEFKDEYHCIGGFWAQCIPFESNEHLLGTADPYVEPYEPKDGDFVYITTIAVCFIAIFKENIRNGIIHYYAIGESGTNYKNGYINFIKSIRLATEEEKQLLLSKMHECNKDWDAEIKGVVDWKWMPKRDDKYFFPSFDRPSGEFDVDDVFWESMDEWFDKAHYERGWVFRTKEECKAMCDKLNEAIKNVK